MRFRLLLVITIVFLVSCDNSTVIKDGRIEISILPQPKHIEIGEQHVELSANSKLYSPHPEVYPLLELVSSEIEKITDIKIVTADLKGDEADIVFDIDTSLQKEAYAIKINKTVLITGGSYFALTKAKSTLLQIIQNNGNTLKLPVVNIEDYPDATYRGLMIDLARKWHDVSTIKKIIDLAAYYKINFLQLHFTDNQSYRLPSEKFPNLPTIKRHYSFEELTELEVYSQLRGVTIIPEIDVPGHSSQLVKKYPEIFAIQAVKTNPSIINMGKEEVYEAMDILIEEVLSVFKSTPYFHIGGDEAIFTGVDKDPDVQKYIAKHNIGTDVHELYRHFLNRMNTIVKKHNKQMCVWEGFGPDGIIKIPNDIIVIPFETNRYLPNDLIKDGYTVVNASWKPLYVVNEKKWSPQTIYKWNMWRWENWWVKAPSFTPIQTNKSELVIGAQMCAWEQEQEFQIPSLRKRLPVFVEKTWNTERGITYEELIERMEVMDIRLSKLIDDNTQDNLLYKYNFKKEIKK